MGLVARHPVGLEYLGLITSMLQRARLTSPSGGVWEAADVQWWWRRDQHPDSSRQVIWFDDGQPVAAVVLSDWWGTYSCDLITSGHDAGSLMEIMWPAALGMMEPYLGTGVEIGVREDDPQLVDLVLRAGFELSGEYRETWMPVTEMPSVSPLPHGFELLSRLDAPARPHHMIRRNGERVGELLSELSLYRPELDLAVYSPQGEVAAYGLFWADPETGVGLVEPMRTEDEYQRLGLGRHVLTAGLERMSHISCSRFKVTFVVGNESARSLYLGVGFRPGVATLGYRLQRA